VSAQMWDRICREAKEVVAAEPALASFVYATVLAHDSLERVVVHRVASALDHVEVPAEVLRLTYETALVLDPGIVMAFRADLDAVDERDPAAGKMVNTLLYFKGFAALQAHRLAHWLWNHSRRDLASYIQSRSSAAFGVDIHPAARVGKGVMIDHGTGVVIGETAVVDDEVSILQGVTLGGTGKEVGDRHPKIRRGVMIGAGATVLGNIEIGAGARVAAGSVVLRAVPAGKTVAGIPSKIVGDADDPAHSMDQNFDPVI
jgi:serine O-acetyltransferase